jgi:molecular chaperone DnaJ
MADYYELLGVPRTASGEEIKRAYRRKARELHPDANPDDTATAERFKEMARAYQVLSDPDQRARYDRFGDAGVGAGAGPRMEDVFGGGGLNDIFDAFFGGQSPFGGGGRRGPSGPPRGQDLEVVADISFEQAVFGATVPVTLRLPQRCEECGGSGAGAGTRPVTCADCNGSGQVQRVRQSLLGQMVTSAPCPRCGGLGQVVVTPCARCRGEGRVTAEHTYQVDVPAGVDSGSTLRLSARGAAGPRGGSAGDLYVHLRVAPHERYRRDGNDLVTDVPISIAQAALGTTVALPTLDGDEELIVPAGTQPGREFILRSRGVPRLQGRGRGDLRAQLVVEVPTKLDDDEAALLRQLAERRGEVVNPPDKGLFSRIKSAFS